MTPLLIPAAPLISTAVPALLQLRCTVGRHASGAGPPNPWHPEPWQRWLPWWWFR
ncbi:hypothetical protein [Lentzea pudingi]|uniref:hypothetical protein n=1 Tax=Lentzea pudingi TaxID=1789439 RepID=UPI00166C5B89|nr:hypothetical protein [Lentzea pudingi]